MAYMQLANRTGKVLINEGFRYQINKRTTGGKIYWHCWRKTCNVFLTTADFNVDEDNVRIHVINTASHNHPKDTDLTARYGMSLGTDGDCDVCTSQDFATHVAPHHQSRRRGARRTGGRTGAWMSALLCASAYRRWKDTSDRSPR
ncbi:hypothetical protein ABVT39_000526 [Epinephelus coioides]